MSIQQTKTMQECMEYVEFSKKKCDYSNPVCKKAIWVLYMHCYKTFKSASTCSSDKGLEGKTLS
jgi:hypothetical protein